MIQGLRHREQCFGCPECPRFISLCYDCSVTHYLHVDKLLSIIHLSVEQAKAVAPANIPRRRICDRCQRRALSCTMCNTCKKVLCNDCDSENTTLRAWIAGHHQDIQPHRSMIVILGTEWRGKEPPRGPCTCRNMSKVLGHCGMCFQRTLPIWKHWYHAYWQFAAFGVGDTRYTCIDCALHKGGTRELCRDCWNDFQKQHDRDHGVETMMFQDCVRDGEPWLEQSIQCIECGQRLNSKIRTTQVLPISDCLHSHERQTSRSSRRPPAHGICASSESRSCRSLET